MTRKDQPKENNWRCGRWKKLEDDRVAEEQQRKHSVEQVAAGPLGSADRAEQLSYLESMAKRNQIFNMTEAFQMLSKELSEMMQRLVRHCTSLMFMMYAVCRTRWMSRRWQSNHAVRILCIPTTRKWCFLSFTA